MLTMDIRGTDRGSKKANVPAWPRLVADPNDPEDVAETEAFKKAYTKRWARKPSDVRTSLLSRHLRAFADDCS